MVDLTHSTWFELPEILIQDLQATTYLDVPRECLCEFANPVRPSVYLRALMSPGRANVNGNATETHLI